MSLALLGCGSGNHGIQLANALSGNWQITLKRVANPIPLTYSGFLVQEGNSVSGALILGDGCSGVGSVTGTLDGPDLELDVNEFGQDLTLTGTVPSSGVPTFLAGQFSTLPGGCSFQSTGTWTAVAVSPLSGPFHGSLVSTEGNGTVNVTGSFSQGPNIGASNATLEATMATNGTPPFCSYVTSATITGTISGIDATLSFFGSNGSLINSGPIKATITPTGTSLTAEYGFLSISKACPGDTGTLQLSFP